MKDTLRLWARAWSVISGPLLYPAGSAAMCGRSKGGCSGSRFDALTPTTTTRPAGASPAHLKWNYWISARPLLVSRTSSPMTVMFSSRPTTRLMLPGIAPPAR